MGTVTFSDKFKLFDYQKLFLSDQLFIKLWGSLYINSKYSWWLSLVWGVYSK